MYMHAVEPRFRAACLRPAIRRVFERTVLSVVVLTVFGIIPGYSQVPDPPGFAPVSVKGSQVISLNVTCFDHQVGEAPPSPCAGELMFHDANGRAVKRETYSLRPGESMSLRLTVPSTVERVTIVPCIIPERGGRAIPSVEVFDREAGRVVLFEHPAAARMSDFNSSPRGRFSEAAFDPQPDPPVFGLMTVRSDQTVRLNINCFDHPVNGLPPSPCQGTIMVHDASGTVLRRGSYELNPGQTRSFEFIPPGSRSSLVGIVPCVLPDPGGTAVPSIEVADAAGGTALLINPAAARASQFQQ